MKVSIIISTKNEEGELHEFSAGGNYIDVTFWANNYGMGSPCVTEEEVQSSVQHAKEWILREGDTYEVVDAREIQSLKNWLK